MDERVISAYATDLDTGEMQKLTTKQNCHFFNRFTCGKYEIQLRLDWGDPDTFNNPMLDADFYDLVTHKIVKSQKNIHRITRHQIYRIAHEFMNGIMKMNPRRF